MLVILHLNTRGGAFLGRLRKEKNLTPRMLPGMARTPGQGIADEKELHVVEGEGWQP